VEQVTTGSRRRTVDQRVQEQAGSTLARYGHFQLTGYIAHQLQVQVSTRRKKEDSNHSGKIERPHLLRRAAINI